MDRVRRGAAPVGLGHEGGQSLLLSARREQRLEALGETRCRYLTTDAFNGLLTPLVVLLFGRLIGAGSTIWRERSRRAEAVPRG